MIIFSKKVKAHIIDIVIVTMVGSLVSLGFVWTIFTWEIFIQNVLYSAIIGTTIWKGNEFVSTLVYKKYALKMKIASFIWINSIGVILWTTFAILVVNYLWSLYEFDCFQEFLSEDGLLVMGIQFIISIIITLILITKSFYTDWLESIKREEHLKHERMAMEYQVLRNQVNPHFLFNSLNTLTSLVEIDAKASTQFIKKLADVYRYVLDQHNKETIELNKELEFTKSYLYLQQIRLHDSLQFSFDVSDNNFLVLPLSIQMLVENCIKHNNATKANPLIIKIFQEENYLVVENNLQKRKLASNETKFADSVNLGLKNLESRYNFLSKKSLKIEETENAFRVKLPMINL